MTTLSGIFAKPFALSNHDFTEEKRAEILSELGWRYRLMGNAAEASSTFLKAIECNFSNAELRASILIKWANAFFDQYCHEKAFKLLNCAERCFPRSGKQYVQLLIDLADLKLSLGRHDEAMDICSKVLTYPSLSNNQMAHLSLIMGDIQNIIHNPDAAFATYCEAEMYQPTNETDLLSIILFRKAHYLEEQEKFDEAHACYKRALDLDPIYHCDTAPLILNQQALLYLDQDKPDLALECFNRALEKKPSNANDLRATILLGCAYLNIGPQAEKDLKEALDCHPKQDVKSLIKIALKVVSK